jgi:hypothetical protein
VVHRGNTQDRSPTCGAIIHPSIRSLRTCTRQAKRGNAGDGIKARVLASTPGIQMEMLVSIRSLRTCREIRRQAMHGAG